MAFRSSGRVSVNFTVFKSWLFFRFKNKELASGALTAQIL
jgi:hypothetical protein